MLLEIQRCEGFAKVVSKMNCIRQQNGNLSIQLYVKQENSSLEHNTEELIANVKAKQSQR
jgi:hypothetical protein